MFLDLDFFSRAQVQHVFRLICFIPKVVWLAGAGAAAAGRSRRLLQDDGHHRNGDAMPPVNLKSYQRFGGGSYLLYTALIISFFICYSIVLSGFIY